MSILTEQHDQVVDVSNEGVKGLQGHVFDDILIIARRFVLNQPLEHILFAGQLACSFVRVTTRRKILSVEKTINSSGHNGHSTYPHK